MDKGKIQIIKENITSLFRKYNLDGSMTQQFVCRYFNTKDINDLSVLKRAKLNPELKAQLTSILRDYFKSVKGSAQVQYIGKCEQCGNINEITLPHELELKFCLYCGKEVNYTKKESHLRR